MEEDNLFLIKHVAEEDQSLDELKKLKEKNIQMQKGEIDKVKKSIADLTTNTSEMFSWDSAIGELHKRIAAKYGEKEEEIHIKN